MSKGSILYLGFVNSLCWVLLLAIAALTIDLSFGVSQAHEHEILKLVTFVKTLI